MIPALQTQICSRALALHVVTLCWDELCAVLWDALCLRVFSFYKYTRIKAIMMYAYGYPEIFLHSHMIVGVCCNFHLWGS